LFNKLEDETAKPGMWCMPLVSSTWEAEMRGSLEFKTSLGNIVRLCLKKKRKGGGEGRAGRKEEEKEEG
jgi:hypothetical protein